MLEFKSIPEPCIWNRYFIVILSNIGIDIIWYTSVHARKFTLMAKINKEGFVPSCLRTVPMPVLAVIQSFLLMCYSDVSFLKSRFFCYNLKISFSTVYFSSFRILHIFFSTVMLNINLLYTHISREIDLYNGDCIIFCGFAQDT